MPMPWQTVTLPDLSGVQAGPAPAFLQKRGLLDQLFGVGNTSGLFDPATQQRAGQMGLLNAGLSLLAAGGRQPVWGPQGRRPNLGQALLGSLQAGQEGYGKVLDSASQLGDMRAKQQAAQMEAAKQAAVAKLQQDYAAIPNPTPEQMAQYASRLSMLEGNAGAAGTAAGVAANLLPEPPKPLQWKEVDRGNVIELRNPVTGEIIDTVKKYIPPKGDGGGNGDLKTVDVKRLQDMYEGNPIVKNAYGIANAAAQIRSAAANVNNPQGDLDIIYNVVKIRDPNSVVREGEIDLQRAARSLGTQVTQAWEKAKQGRMLTQQERNQIVSLLDVKVKAAQDQMKPFRDSALKYAQKLGVSPEDLPFIISDPFAGQGPQAEAAAPTGQASSAFFGAPAAPVDVNTLLTPKPIPTQDQRDRGFLMGGFKSDYGRR